MWMMTTTPQLTGPGKTMMKLKTLTGMGRRMTTLTVRLTAVPRDPAGANHRQALAAESSLSRHAAAYVAGTRLLHLGGIMLSMSIRCSIILCWSVVLTLPEG